MIFYIYLEFSFNTKVHHKIQTLIVKTDHLALKLGSKK